MPTHTHNLLLTGLTAPCLATLLADGERLTLPAGERLYESGDAITQVYFPEDATLSLTVCARGLAVREIGEIGREGMLGVGAILDIPIAEFRAEVQSPGRFLRLEVARLRQGMLEYPVIRSRMNRYAFIRLLQMAQDITCQHDHRVEGRLACQLLLARDRTRSNHIAFTHESLARVLGVRRAGVTLAASALRRRELVNYSRGSIAIVDAAGLRAAACGCYASNRNIYARFMGPGRDPE